MTHPRDGALAPGATIGILGSGQLGRMLAIAAARLGFTCHIYADTTGPAFDVAAASTVGPYEDLGKIRSFAESVDVVTYEFENVPLGAAAAASAVAPVRPGPRALEVAQDRLVEKRFVDELGIRVAPFANIDSLADLESALTTIGAPAILKTSRLGYDGKGQVRIASRANPAWALDTIGGAPAILEGAIDFDFEISVLAVRDLHGNTSFYDLPRNEHRDGILHISTVPAPDLPAEIAKQATSIAGRIASAIDYVGVLAVEMFCVKTGDGYHLLVNELAPRVHNSGHWTLDACHVDQFENHIRAIAGWPIGSTERHTNAVMRNLIGAEISDWPQLSAQRDVCLHIYGKNEARPGRKMGHITTLTKKSP